jgi:hypothetical protein
LPDDLHNALLAAICEAGIPVVAANAVADAIGAHTGLLDALVAYRRKQPIVGCGVCLWCRNEQRRAAHALKPNGPEPYPPMTLCPDCGNKRCPKASHHDHGCTRSNDPGQSGSVYGDFKLDTSWLEEEPYA